METETVFALFLVFTGILEMIEAPRSRLVGACFLVGGILTLFL